MHVIAALDSGAVTVEECAKKFGFTCAEVNSIYRKRRNEIELEERSGGVQESREIEFELDLDVEAQTTNTETCEWKQDQDTNWFKRRKKNVESEKRGRRKVTEEIKQQIIAALESGASTKTECAKKFGLTYYQVKCMYQRHKEAVELEEVR